MSYLSLTWSQRMGMQNMKWKRIYGVETRTCLFYVTLLLWTRRMNGLADFSNYLNRIITSHSAVACDGRSLHLNCPRHSTISIQSAFYGSRDALLCSGHTPVSAENHSCSASTALQKLLSECQSQRDCHLPVNHLLFGKDPCPGTTKYLHVDYKCKPTEHRRRVGCEGESLTLHCKPLRVLNIYAAVYGRGLAETDACPSALTRPPPFECLNYEAAHIVSQSCYSKQRCVIAVSNQTFRDPCSPGTRKYLTVLYACVPDTLLREADRDASRPSSTPEQDRGNVPPDVVRPYSKGSRKQTHSGAMMSNSLITYTYVKEHPEMAALLFTSSVCVGLLFTMLAVSVRVTCRGRHHSLTAKCTRQDQASPGNEKDAGVHDDETDDDETDSSLVSATDWTLLCGCEEETYMTEAAERAERIERRDMVIQEIWMTSYHNGNP